MATKTYFSIGGQAKPTRKAYCSVGGKAKPIKRVYASVNGQAKIIYDTAVITYIKDNGYTNNTTVTYTERIAIGTKATNFDNLHWYKSDGTEWNFNNTVTGDMTLYEAVYQSIDKVTFDGSHYVPTDIKPKVSDLDIRVYGVTPSATTRQMRIFSICGSPYIALYVNGSGYWNCGLGNSTSSITWSAAGNKVQCTTNKDQWFRMNVAASSPYLQVWISGDSDSHWSGITKINNVTSNAGFLIGYDTYDSDTRGSGFRGTINNSISYTGNVFRTFQRKKGGSTVQGFKADINNKFYPLVSI